MRGLGAAQAPISPARDAPPLHFSGGWFGLQKAGSLREQGDAFLQGAPKIELLAQSCAEGDSQFGDFGLEGFIALESSGHMALEHVPDLHEQFARDGGYGDVALAFAQKKLPAPLTQGCFAAGA